MNKTFSERFTIARECYYGHSLMRCLENLFKEVDNTIHELKYQAVTAKQEATALKEQNQALLEELADINLAGKEEPQLTNPALINAAKQFLKSWPIDKGPYVTEYEFMGQLAQDILNRQS